MNILGIETSGEMCSVALLHGQNEFEIRRLSRKRHSEILMDMVEGVLHRGRIPFSALSAVAVDVGPGSYTGLRIGIMTAKALSFALGARAAPVPSLLALAHSVLAESKEQGASSQKVAAPFRVRSNGAQAEACGYLIAPCLAGLGTEVYTALYKRREVGLTKLEDFRRIGIEEWLEHLSRQFSPWQICFAGSGAARHRDLILRRGFRISLQAHPQALWIARLGRSQLLRQRRDRPLNPIYLTRRVI